MTTPQITPCSYSRAYILFVLSAFCCSSYPDTNMDGLQMQQTNEGNKDPSVVLKIQRCGYNFFYELLKPRGLYVIFPNCWDGSWRARGEGHKFVLNILWIIKPLSQAKPLWETRCYTITTVYLLVSCSYGWADWKMHSSVIYTYINTSQSHFIWT